MHILYVESDETTRLLGVELANDIFGDQLVLDGVATYDESFEKLSETIYDAVIADYIISDKNRPPTLSGAEFCSYINIKYPSTDLFIFSASSQPGILTELGARGIKLSPDRIFGKPNSLYKIIEIFKRNGIPSKPAGGQAAKADPGPMP